MKKLKVSQEKTWAWKISTQDTWKKQLKAWKEECNKKNGKKQKLYTAVEKIARRRLQPLQLFASLSGWMICVVCYVRYEGEQV